MTMTQDVSERVNLNSLSHDERKALTEATYAKKSYFQDLFSEDQVEVDCEKIAFAFRGEIERILLEKKIIDSPIELEKLHEYVSEEMKTYNFDDGVNKISTYFYETDAHFQAVYHQFVKHLRENFVKEPFYFQSTPTIRIHCPKGINNHHYPRYHSDVSYGHPPEEINIWFPLTHLLTGHGFRTMSVASSKTAINKFGYDFSAFIQSAIHDKDFSNYCDNLSNAVNTPLGKALAFDSRCVHTGEPLKEHTRVSMDIRIIPVARYEQMEIEYQGSGRRKILFAPGHCYHEHDSDHFINIKGM